LVVLILTGDSRPQHDLLGDASEVVQHKEAIDRAATATSVVELVAALNAPVQ